MADLITLAQYKTYATIASDEYDDRLKAIISNVSQIVRHYCARELISDGSTEIVEVNSGGYSFIFPKEFPLVSLTSIERSTDYGATYSILTEFIDYVVDNEREGFHLITEDGIRIPNKYKVTYIGGYIEIPLDLQMAVLDLVSYYYKDENVPKRMSNFVTIEYVKTTDFPPHIKRILDLYRVV